jgi:hypothetical protein
MFMGQNLVIHRSSRVNRGLLPEDPAAVMNQTLQPMGCYVQRGGIHCTFVAARRPGALGFENVVDFVLDI